MSTTQTDVANVDIISNTVDPIIPDENEETGFSYKIVGSVAIAHLMNDLIQAVLPSIYPMLKIKYSLTFAEIGWMAMTYQLVASILQPWVGMYTDKHYRPYLLPLGMIWTLVGVIALSFSNTYILLILSACTIGVGSAIFHPEASRIARMASGGRFGTAQSAFQVGGNAGSALGPVVASLVILPLGQLAFGWLTIFAVAAIWILYGVSQWRLKNNHYFFKAKASSAVSNYSKKEIIRALSVIAVLMFAKFIYIGAFTNYFTFYLMERFQLTAQEAPVYLFYFLGAVALGTFAGGPIGDRLGRKMIIWISFLGVAPFSLLLPHMDLFWTCSLAVLIGLIMSSAFAALVVYAQEIIPGRVGTVSGVMFGLMFGIGGIGAAALGNLADVYGVIWVYKAVSFLPLLGFATAFLPKVKF